MKICWPTRTCLLFAVLAGSGCGSITQLGSSNLDPLVAQFPFQASTPIARELRYTYMYVVMLDGKPHKTIFAADEATRALGAAAPRPGAVLAAASAAGPRVSDEISRRAREAEQRGADQQVVDSLRGQAVAAGSTENALGRAQAGANVAFAMGNFLGSLEGLGQIWTESWAKFLGEWVQKNTGAIGPAAPAESVLQLDFVWTSVGRAFRPDSRLDLLVHATLRDGSGRTLESRQGFQVYTYMGQPTIEIPPDAVRVPPGMVPLAKQHLTKELYASNVWSPHLAVIASSALADLYRQIAPATLPTGRN